jgi:phage N-6-adenine-methyltransferase
MIEYNSACFSKGKPDWGTNPKLFKQLDEEFNFILDPCTSMDNPLGTMYFYTKRDDGLNKFWAGNIYCNPPYGSDINKWLEKGLKSLKYCKVIVYLLPARTDTKWFHEYVYNSHSKIWWNWVKEVRFLRGRQKMIDMDNPNKKPNTAPFPSMIVVFGDFKRFNVIGSSKQYVLDKHRS